MVSLSPAQISIARDDGESAGDAIVQGLISHTLHAMPRRFVPPVRVLIADDYEDAALSLAMLLSQTGALTQVARDGEEALACFERWKPQVCVLDLQMPKIDGRDVARRIARERGAERPLLIALTGWTSPSDRNSALEAGFDHFLIKPVEPTGLLQLIENHVGRHPDELVTVPTENSRG